MVRLSYLSPDVGFFRGVRWNLVALTASRALSRIISGKGSVYPFHHILPGIGMNISNSSPPSKKTFLIYKP
ncbi:hypothetical protein [Spirulina subsalsa]|uniref:hypothetical protein n=1 Tax=Spirulina subsalsa TaxID=54311 RepID=UPI001ED99F32|nr:hypothetical protein [Spirulina subsalsa]